MRNGARVRVVAGLAAIAAVVGVSVDSPGFAAGTAPVSTISPDFPADAKSAPSSDLALRLAQAYQHPVEVSSETTETSQVTAQPDGTLLSQSFAEPVRVDVDGAWQPI